MLLTASASIFSTSFACLSLSSSALSCLNRASSEKFSRNARRRRGREVQVSIMCSLIFFFDISELTCFLDFTKSGVITIQRFPFFLLRLSKIVHFIGGVDLWIEIFVQFRHRCVILTFFPGFL